MATVQPVDWYRLPHSQLVSFNGPKVRAIKKIPARYIVRMKDRKRLLGDKVDGERERERERERGWVRREIHIGSAPIQLVNVPTQFREEGISQEVVVRLLSNALQRGM